VSVPSQVSGAAPWPALVLASPPGVEVRGPHVPGAENVLTMGALELLADLARRFGGEVSERLSARRDRLMGWRGGEPMDFLASTASVRAGDWRCAPPPAELADRRVEITGPINAKMVINALNSGANVFMADFEDASSPTFANAIDGQVNLIAAVRRNLEYRQPETGKRYTLAERTAALFVRPRGWHLVEAHMLVDGRPIPAALFDVGLFLIHNAVEQVARGSGPYLYLPKLESHLEARLWNRVLGHIETRLGLPSATVRATCLIETLPAAFEMDEILFELRERSLGLNCGRWDYIFSCIKVWAEDRAKVIPDRGAVGMTQPFLRAYTRLLIKTCHRRGVHAMGGMAAQIPIKGDEAANAAAFEQVRVDKQREAEDGHDGTWVAHPALVRLAREVFDRVMPGPNQIDSAKQATFAVTAADLVGLPDGECTRAGLAHNVRIGLQYLAAWLGGVGAVPLHNLMEDAATAEISRAQIWQMARHNVRLDTGEVVTHEFVERIIAEELARLRARMGDGFLGAEHLEAAERLMHAVATSPVMPDFLTLPAYAVLLEVERRSARTPM